MSPDQATKSLTKQDIIAMAVGVQKGEQNFIANENKTFSLLSYQVLPASQNKLSTGEKSSN